MLSLYRLYALYAALALFLLARGLASILSYCVLMSDNDFFLTLQCYLALLPM